MKNVLRVTSLTLITVLILNLFVIINVEAASVSLTHSDTIIVDINGEGDYISIQEAVNNAQPGSTIYIKKGEYPEVINIKKQIELVGEDKDTTIINPVSGTNKYAINLGAEDAKISDLIITNSGPGLYTSGVRITASNTMISNCKIYDTPVGIAIWTSNNLIENCIFKGCEDEGIALLGTSYSDCNNNKIINCIFQENCDGIELQYSSKNTIDNCEFFDNTHDGIDAIAADNNENIITNCKIYNNQVHGIYLSSSSDNKIIDCYIKDNEGGNIVMRGDSVNNEMLTSSEPVEPDTTSKENSVTTLIQNIIARFLSRFSNHPLRRTLSLLNNRSLLNF